MGICQTQLKTVNQKHNDHSGEFQIEKEKKSHWKQISRMKRQTSPPKLYDYTNPHRQYNVLINGALFDVVNSMELSQERPHDEHEL